MVGREKTPRLYEYSGAVHLHSTVSDGSLPIPEIAAIAEEKGLDFVMFSDHHTLEPKRQGLEGWYGSLFALIGYEINDRDNRNHYLAFKIDNEAEGDTAEEYVSEVNKAGGIGIIAHPAEKRQFSDAYPPYPWTNWDIEGFDGIEIWNQLSEWMEGLTRGNMFWRIWHPLRSIRFPEWEILRRWDSFNKERRVVGIGGIDVHAFPLKVLGIIPIEVYPYKVQFKSIRTHILTKRQLIREGDRLPAAEAEKEIYNAICLGRCFICNYSLGDARGFVFRAGTGNGEAVMGSRFRTENDVRFYTAVPQKAHIRLLRDGIVVAETKGTAVDYISSEPGVYRVEVFRKKRGWIYSNPIVLLDSEEKK